jgi:hypothetical protein
VPDKLGRSGGQGGGEGERSRGVMSGERQREGVKAVSSSFASKLSMVVASGSMPAWRSGPGRSSETGGKPPAAAAARSAVRTRGSRALARASKSGCVAGVPGWNSTWTWDLGKGTGSAIWSKQGSETNCEGSTSVWTRRTLRDEVDYNWGGVPVQVMTSEAQSKKQPSLDYL